jgi:hypothetical protein
VRRDKGWDGDALHNLLRRATYDEMAALLLIQLWWSAASTLHSPAVECLQRLGERLVTDRPVRTTNQGLLGILLQEKLTPMLLAAADVGA